MSWYLGGSENKYAENGFICLVSILPRLARYVLAGCRQFTNLPEEGL